MSFFLHFGFHGASRRALALVIGLIKLKNGLGSTSVDGLKVQVAPNQGAWSLRFLSFCSPGSIYVEIVVFELAFEDPGALILGDGGVIRRLLLDKAFNSFEKSSDGDRGTDSAASITRLSCENVRAFINRKASKFPICVAPRFNSF
ncbi:hypothetical protein GOBAR_AA27510 [Gossypium barbadense]|uniref:Uncharacterized protein n=1 Tax=Gossypium barbadense TaxID=3634 RepID=A0A2P5WPZ3_GOSBA|nr:hypothetical protein GOBAR_AA27510 [Gossypium barbadense]